MGKTSMSSRPRIKVGMMDMEEGTDTIHIKVSYQSCDEFRKIC